MEEDGQEAKAGEESGQRGHDPVHILAVAGPSEPEQTDGKGRAADDDGGKTPFGDGHVLVGGQLAVVGRLEQDDEERGEELADDHAEEGKAADAGVEAVHLLEDERIRGQEEIQQAVDEGHVDGEQEDDRLGEEDAQGPTEVLVDELAEVDFDLLLLRVDAPVLGASSEFGGFLDEEHGRVGLLHEQHVENPGESAHDAHEILGPSPSEMTLDDETTDERSEEGSREDGTREEGDGQSATAVVEHVREHGGHDGEGTRSEEATPESTDQNRLKIFASRHSELEDGKAESGDQDSKSTSLQFR